MSPVQSVQKRRCSGIPYPDVPSISYLNVHNLHKYYVLFLIVWISFWHPEVLYFFVYRLLIGSIQMRIWWLREQEAGVWRYRPLPRPQWRMAVLPHWQFHKSTPSTKWGGCVLPGLRRAVVAGWFGPGLPFPGLWLLHQCRAVWDPAHGIRWAQLHPEGVLGLCGQLPPNVPREESPDMRVRPLCWAHMPGLQ